MENSKENMYFYKGKKRQRPCSVYHEYGTMNLFWEKNCFLIAGLKSVGLRGGGNPLSPNSHKLLISPYNTTTGANVQVTRI